MVKFIQLKNTAIIKFCLAGLLLFTFSCKHKQKAVTAVEKKVVKKAEPKPKSGEPATANTSDGASVLKEKLGLTSNEIKHNKLYSFITDWYGIPYKYGGCQKSGVDCSCFACVLYENVYGKVLSRVAGDMFKACNEIAGDRAKEGDLIFFKINSKQITHVGIYLKDDYFVHASTSKGVMISSIKEAYYKKYLYCAGRVKT